jgi:hypothetical protein
VHRETKWHFEIALLLNVLSKIRRIRTIRGVSILYQFALQWSHEMRVTRGHFPNDTAEMTTGKRWSGSMTEMLRGLLIAEMSERIPAPSGRPGSAGFLRGVATQFTIFFTHPTESAGFRLIYQK